MNLNCGKYLCTARRHILFKILLLVIMCGDREGWKAPRDQSLGRVERVTLGWSSRDSYAETMMNCRDETAP